MSECPIELPVKRFRCSVQDSLSQEVYGIEDSILIIAQGMTKEQADYIVEAINCHEKLITVVRHLVSSTTRYPDDYATKDLNKLIPYLIKEAKQALEEAEKS